MYDKNVSKYGKAYIQIQAIIYTIYINEVKKGGKLTLQYQRTKRYLNYSKVYTTLEKPSDREYILMISPVQTLNYLLKIYFYEVFQVIRRKI